MKLPRNLKGRHLTDVLIREWEYVEVHQQGSHIILETKEPSHQRIPVPDHRALRVGTLSAILCAVARHKNVEREQILNTL